MEKEKKVVELDDRQIADLTTTIAKAVDPYVQIHWTRTLVSNTLQRFLKTLPQDQDQNPHQDPTENHR